jgi:acetyltransferase-like isoleucine patch superfamily enzyme
MNTLVFLPGGKGFEVAWDFIYNNPNILTSYDSTNVMIIDDRPIRINTYDCITDEQTGKIYDIHIKSYTGIQKTLDNLRGLRDIYVILTTSNMKLRTQLYDQCTSYGFHILNIFEEELSNLKIGNGNFIFKSSISRLATIGNNNVVSTGCIINHHNEIGNNNLFGPGCLLSGTVKIGSNCLIGSGVVFEPHVVIGDSVKICSNVTIKGNISANFSVKSTMDMRWPEVYQGALIRVENHKKE